MRKIVYEIFLNKDGSFRKTICPLKDDDIMDLQKRYESGEEADKLYILCLSEKDTNEMIIQIINFYCPPRIRGLVICLETKDQEFKAVLLNNYGSLESLNINIYKDLTVYINEKNILPKIIAEIEKLSAKQFNIPSAFVSQKNIINLETIFSRK